MFNAFRFQSPELKYWLWASFFVLLIQMYFSTGTMSAYAATFAKPALYHGYYVNLDWPQYVYNYKFITGQDHTTWEHGLVLRRLLLYVMGYPFMKLFGFFLGSMITILLFLFITLIYFFRFIEKEFGVYATKIAMVLLCSYSGIMYWIGSPFVQNLIVPLCLWIYILLYRMQKGDFQFNIFALFAIGILFTGYDLLPLFAPGILLFILFRKKMPWHQKIALVFTAVVAFLLPQIIIKYWLILRGYHAYNSNDEAYQIILTAYLNIFKEIPEWLFRIKSVPETFLHCFFYSNFFILPSLFLLTWIPGRFLFQIKLNLIERCLLLSILFLFFFNNMAPPYEGEWQMWGDWLARIYQAVFIVYLMYIVRLASHLYKGLGTKLIFSMVITLAVVCNLIINTGGLYASGVTSYIYGSFYKHGDPDSYRKNILYYGARPWGFPVYYNSEIKD